MLSPEFKVLSREVIVKENANRPHTSLAGGLLITTWDAEGSIWLQIDKALDME